MSKYQDALNNVRKFEREHNMSKFGDVVPQPNSDTLQELVDKEKPMNPIRKGVLNWWHCPCCDASLYFDNQPRCQKCGQKLDWSDSNE